MQRTILFLSVVALFPAIAQQPCDRAGEASVTQQSISPPIMRPTALPSTDRRMPWSKSRLQPVVGWSNYQVPRNGVEPIRTALRRCQFSQAAKLYFGESYDKRLADWIIYVDTAGTVRHTLLHDGDSTGVYRSQRYLWIVIFAEKKPGEARPFIGTTPNSESGTDVEFSRRVKRYEQDPFLRAAVNVALATFGASAEVKEGELGDSSSHVTLSPISSDTSERLYVGMARFGVVDNVQMVLSMHPDKNREFPNGLQSVYTNMVNSSGSRWEFGLATGASYNPRPQRRVGDDPGATGTDTLHLAPKFRANLLFTLYLNVSRPQLPLTHRTFSLVGGTSATNLMQDIFLGIGGTAWQGKGGFILGAIWEQDVEWKTVGGILERREHKFPRLFVGTDLRL